MQPPPSKPRMAHPKACPLLFLPLSKHFRQRQCVLRVFTSPDNEFLVDEVIKHHSPPTIAPAHGPFSVNVS